MESVNEIRVQQQKDGRYKLSVKYKDKYESSLVINSLENIMGEVDMMVKELEEMA